MQQWEYCELTCRWEFGGIEFDTRESVNVVLHRSFGVLNIFSSKDSADRSKALAKLGDEGWELVSAERLDGLDSMSINYYFKRPKQE